MLHRRSKNEDPINYVYTAIIDTIKISILDTKMRLSYIVTFFFFSLQGDMRKLTLHINCGSLKLFIFHQEQNTRAY